MMSTENPAWAMSMNIPDNFLNRISLNRLFTPDVPTLRRFP